MAKAKRDARIIILVTDAERRELRKKARREQKYIGEIVREALGFTPRQRA